MTARQRQPELPAEVAFELSRLRLANDSLGLDRLMLALRQAGWTLQSIADELDMTRERVRQRVDKLLSVDRVFLPEVPVCPPKPGKPRKVRGPRIRPEVVDRLRELSAMARLARAGVAHPEYQRASRQLAGLMHELTQQGITVPAIARACGITPAAVNMRLGRFGYKKQPPSLAHLNVTFLRGRARTGTQDACAHGHPLSGDNLRIVGGNGPSAGLRVCRACERRRHDEYLARKREAAS